MELGVPVYIADSEAKKIMDYPETIQEVQAIFDENVILEDGKLNRKKIASIVFNAPEKLQHLNAVVHPKVNQDFKKWLELHKEAPYIIKEVAIIFEIGSENQFDKIILVTAPEQTRIQKVAKRDNISEDEVLARIKNQLSDAEKIEKSDFIINNIDLNTSKNKVRKLHQTLILS